MPSAPFSQSFRCPPRSRRGGFTLPELLISMVLMAIVLAMTATTLLTMVKGSQSLVNYAEMNTASRFALQDLGRNLRSANDVAVASGTELRFTRLDSAGTEEEIQYLYDTSAQTLTVNNLTTGSSRILLKDINTLSLNYFTLRHANTTNPLEVKHVQLEAELRRQVLALTNRNYIISARFMLRNRRVSN